MIERLALQETSAMQLHIDAKGETCYQTESRTVLFQRTIALFFAVQIVSTKFIRCHSLCLALRITFQSQSHHAFMPRPSNAV